MIASEKAGRFPGGYPYAFHPFYLAVQMDDEESACAALLHDMVEDHGGRYSFDGLARSGFPETVVRLPDVVKRITGLPSERFHHFVCAVR